MWPGDHMTWSGSHLIWAKIGWRLIGLPWWSGGHKGGQPATHFCVFGPCGVEGAVGSRDRFAGHLFVQIGWPGGHKGGRAATEFRPIPLKLSK